MSKSQQPQIQGEGNYDAAREYNRQTRAFIATGKVKEAADKSAPRNDREAEEMRQAEAEGKSHAKGGKQPPGPGTDKPPKRAPGVNPPAKPIPEKLPGR